MALTHNNDEKREITPIWTLGMGAQGRKRERSRMTWKKEVIRNLQIIYLAWKEAQARAKVRKELRKITKNNEVI